MRRIERVCDLNCPIEEGVQWKRLSLNLVRQRLAFEQFHRNIRRAVEFSDLVNRANVGMIDGSSGFRFTLESLNGGSVAAHLFREELQCNFALKLQIFGTVHNTHAAAAKLLDHAIVRN